MTERWLTNDQKKKKALAMLAVPCMVLSSFEFDHLNGPCGSGVRFVPFICPFI